MKICKMLQRGLKHGMHRKVVCMFSCEPWKKNRALKSILHLSCSMSSLLQLPFQPPGTGNSHVPCSKTSSCSITLVRPTKPRDTAVLQVSFLGENSFHLLQPVQDHHTSRIFWFSCRASSAKQSCI